jgi:hypothetical protein
MSEVTLNRETTQSEAAKFGVPSLFNVLHFLRKALTFHTRFFTC